MSLHQILSSLQQMVWGPWVLLALMGIGCYFSWRLGLLQVFKLPLAVRLMLGRQTHKKGEAGDVSPFAALCTALAATIGTGNIVGVATTLKLGGPGALFWMWIAAFIGMTTKYAECLLGVKYRQKDNKGNIVGGPMHYLEQGAKQPFLAKLFAVFGIFVALFGIGTFAQVNAITETLVLNFGFDKVWCAVLLATLVGLSVIGGIKSISKVATTVVPVMAVIYVFAACGLLFANRGDILPALNVIVASAFDTSAVGGGLLGASILAIQTGVARGVFSNEAGLGSAAIAASAARSHSCAEQGLISMTGTFIDTLIICTMTGLVLVMSGMHHGDLNGVALTMAAFSIAPFDVVGPWVVSLGLVFFAFTTILGWNYYGERCLVYLTGTRAIGVYRLIFVLLVAAGAFLQLENIWLLADVVNGLMIIPNVIGLFLLRHVVVQETKLYFEKKMRTPDPALEKDF